MKELTENFVREYLKQKGYILLQLIKQPKNEISDSVRYIIFKDSLGYKYKTQWENFKNSKNFKQVTYSNPFAVENAKLYLKLNNMNVELLSDEIKSVTSLLDFKCSKCGKPFKCSWVKIKNRKNFLCDNCLKTNKKAYKQKLSEQEILNVFNKHGFVPLNIKQYRGNASYMDFKDKEGYKYYYKYSNLSQDKIPRKISPSNKYSIDNIKNYIKLNNLHSELLSKEYKNEKELLKFKCNNCGTIFYNSWSNFKNQKYGCCEKCNNLKRGTNLRLDIKTVKDKFKELGLILLDDNYTGNDKRLLCEDNLGYRGYISYNHLNRIKESTKNGFDYFSIKHNEDNIIYNLNNFCKLNNLKTVAIKILKNDKRYSNYSILFKCDCGENFITTINSFVSGKQRCDKCSDILSTYEFKTLTYLDSLNVNYERQKRFNDCRNILPLPFDFYIDSLSLAIEVDGEGHFKVCNFNQCSYENGLKTFELTKKNDEIKNEYCHKNNIKLLRIPYWEFNNNNYKKILFNNIINV